MRSEMEWERSVNDKVLEVRLAWLKSQLVYFILLFHLFCFFSYVFFSSPVSLFSFYFSISFSVKRLVLKWEFKSLCPPTVVDPWDLSRHHDDEDNKHDMRG